MKEPIPTTKSPFKIPTNPIHSSVLEAAAKVADGLKQDSIRQTAMFSAYNTNLVGRILAEHSERRAKMFEPISQSALAGFRGLEDLLNSSAMSAWQARSETIGEPLVAFRVKVIPPTRPPLKLV